MLKTMQQLSQLKANLVELADVLLTGDIERTQSEIAYELLLNVERIVTMEQRVQEMVRKKVTIPLNGACEIIEQNREKENHLAGNEMAVVSV